MRTRDLKALAEEYEEKYDEAMMDELIERLTAYLKGLTVDEVSSDTIYDIAEDWKSSLPEQNDWCYAQVDSDLDDYGDQKYQEWKERDI